MFVDSVTHVTGIWMDVISMSGVGTDFYAICYAIVLLNPSKHSSGDCLTQTEYAPFVDKKLRKWQISKTLLEAGATRTQ